MLKQIPLFSTLQDDELTQLHKVVERKTYAKGERMVQEGDKSTELYIVTAGKAIAIKQDYKGQETILNTFPPGEYFGELSFIDAESRSATVKAEEETDVIIVPRHACTTLFPMNSALSTSLTKGLVRKLRDMTTQFTDLISVVAQEELHDAHLDTIRRLVKAAEHMDEDTGGHIHRISEYSRWVAEKIGLSDTLVQYIGEAAPMHDIGKLGIPQYILQKPGRLTDEEFTIIQTHPTIGAKILSNPKSELLQYAHAIALSHHEKFDGTGYPIGLRAFEIPLAARIVALVDAFDTLTTKRPYKEAVPAIHALERLKRDRGTHFDPAIIDVFVRDFEEILNIQRTFFSPSL